MDFACLILNYNNYKDTISCVDNIIHKEIGCPVIIVDNASTDCSVEELAREYERFEMVSLVCETQNGGYSKGNNAGFRYIFSKYPLVEYVLVMNPDTTFSTVETVLKLRDALAKDEDLAVVAPLVRFNGEVNYRLSAWDIPNARSLLARHLRVRRAKGKQFVDRDSKGIVKVEAVQGAFFMIKKRALMEIGLLDENTFLYCEEVLLARDLREKNYNEAVVSEVIFDHNHPCGTERTLRWRLDDEWKHYISRRRYSEKYLNSFISILLFVETVINIIVIIPWHFARKIGNEKNIS